MYEFLYVIQAGGFKQRMRTIRIRHGEDERVSYGIVNMTFSREMDYAIYAFEQLHQSLQICNITLDERVVLFPAYGVKISRISCIRQFVVIYEIMLRIFVDHLPHEIAAHETCATRDKDFHFCSYPLF